MESASEVHEQACQLFVDAAGRGDMDGVATPWRDGLIADIDCRSGADDGPTALLLAVSNGHMAIVQFLLDHGASTESRDCQSCTPLLVAAKADNAAIVHLLYDRGWTPLDFAIADKNTVAIQRMVAKGANIMRQNERGETVLFRACIARDVNAVAHILEALDEVGVVDTKRALVNMPCLGNWTPLALATYRADLPLVVLLTTHGADVESKIDEGYSPLTMATRNGYDAIVRHLVMSGADTETTETSGNTPLVIASARGSEATVDVLLEHGANIHHRDMAGFTALLAAAKEDHAAIVEKLLIKGADPEARIHIGLTPLLLAAENADARVVQLLIENGADVNCQGYDYSTPLRTAAKHGHTAVCALLLEHGATTANRTTDGQTALHAAASRGHQETVQVLVAAGADTNVRDLDGRTAAHAAMLNGFIAVAELLGDEGTTETESDDNEIWPRHALRALYGVAPLDNGEENPPWYIDRSRIASIEPCPRLTTPFAHVSIGTWLGSRVVIVETETAFDSHLDVDQVRTRKRFFREEVSKLYPLRHPHVIRLYGACHRGDKPFVVLEHPQSGTLRSFVGDHRNRTWAILHDVARGVQYLHERGIVHGRLQGDNMVIGDDGLVKLSAFGAYSMFAMVHSLEWDAPEVVGQKASASFDTDVYALGMCILEAIGGQTPYASALAANRKVEELVLSGVPPARPAELCARGWELVMQMIAFKRSKRLQIADVVRELAALAQDEALEVSRKPASHDKLNGGPDSNDDMDETFARARSLLSVLEHGVEKERDPETPQSQVYHRLYETWQASECLPPSRIDIVRPGLQGILTRFSNDLAAQVSMGLASRFAAQRKHVDHIFSIHSETDRLLNEHSELRKAMKANSIHAWRDRWYAYRQTRLKAFGVTLVTRVNEWDVETCTFLLYELTRRRDAYTSIPPSVIETVCCTMRKMSGVRVPDWFIPHYEVAFDGITTFSRGAFGSVHHGEWMGSRAVIKKVLVDDDAEFQKEAEIWSRLYHPHVLQLFGACHVGQKFLISEYAAHGQLDHYLRSLEAEPARRNREVWRTLHEAALGLQYLHARGIVHCDLKCNNILIGRDGKAKVSDYGLSRPQQQPEPSSTSDGTSNSHVRIGAPRWKAPEVLNGSEPTIESDIYSFGMCVVEAVTGEYPWGMKDRDELISDHVRRGGALFSKPNGFSDAQWALVVGACHFDPAERLQLPDIAAQLESFVNEASEIDAAVDEAAGKLDENKPEMGRSSVWGGSEAISLSALPVVFDDLSMASADDDPGASYRDSW